MRRQLEIRVMPTFENPQSAGLQWLKSSQLITKNGYGFCGEMTLEKYIKLKGERKPQKAEIIYRLANQTMNMD